MLILAAALATLTCARPMAIDGDTLRCNSRQSVRLWGIQAPELGQPGAAASRQSLQRFIQGGVVCEISGRSYQRVVGRCYNRRLWDVGFFQLCESHATEWRRYSRGFYRNCGRK